MALRRHKPLPKFRDPTPPNVVLTLSEAEALMRAVMGDPFDSEHIDTAVAKIGKARDDAHQMALQTGSAGGGSDG